MQETYTALDADSRRIALMGARTIIERTMVLTAGDVGTFGANLKQFEDLGFLSKHNRKFLEIALEAGHAASHRGHKATPEVVGTVMDIVENMIHGVFVLSKDAEKIRNEIPTRSDRKAKK